MAAVRALGDRGGDGVPWGSSGPEIDRLALTRRGVVREARRCDPRVFVAAIRRESSSGEWGSPDAAGPQLAWRKARRGAPATVAASVAMLLH